jgi:thiol-disulfide isomerase/thioredoxin
MRGKKLRVFLASTLIGLLSLLLASCADGTNSGQTSSSNNLEAEKLDTTQNGEVGQGSYISYESYESTSDLYENSEVILFFNASWCSTCKVARDNFEASLDQIPADLAIVVVDFDNSDDLRKRYGVTLQHTFVQIDSNGDALKKWSGSTTISELVKQTV